MNKELKATMDGNTCTVATTQAATICAYHATTDGERSDMGATAVNLLSALMSLNDLGRCETKEEVKELLGEAVLWLMFMHFVHVQEGDKDIPCKWLKGDDWAVRGPDRGLDQWATIMVELREKTNILAKAFCRYHGTAVERRGMVSKLALQPVFPVILFDRKNPGGDVKALCDMYKLSPRECYEAAFLKRKDTFIRNHKKTQGKHACK